MASESRTPLRETASFSTVSCSLTSRFHISAVNFHSLINEPDKHKTGDEGLAAAPSRERESTFVLIN
jgi:hypothetical protein